MERGLGIIKSKSWNKVAMVNTYRGSFNAMVILIGQIRFKFID